VASSVQALAEMVQHEKTGLLFEKGNIDSLADTLARLINDPALRRKLGKAGRKWVKKERTWEKTAAVAASIFADLA
jgi:glycosyltransferase involved in cell wall biosynthesis